MGQAVTVNVAGQSVQLGVGQSVNVLGVSNGMAMIRVTLPDGSVSATEIPVAGLRIKPVQSALPTATPPAPMAAAPAATPAAPAPPSASATPAATPVAAVPAAPDTAASPSTSPAASQTLKPGLSKILFAALPAPVPAKRPRGFNYDFDPAKEIFSIYVPRNYNPHVSCGVVGWTNTGDRPDIPKKYEALFDEFGLIAVAATDCGNGQKSDRRVGLLVSAILELSQMTAIDQHRLVLSGFSGGGRLSALGGFVHPEIFCGAISWCGGNFYKDYPDSSRPGYISFGINHGAGKLVSPQDVVEAKRNVKFVLLTGPKDMNLTDSHDIQAAMKKEGFRVSLIEEPGLGHQAGSADTMRQALVLVLGEPAKP